MRTRSSVVDTLSVLLPTPSEADLVGACLLAGQPARDAWTRWRAGRASSDDVARRDLAARRTWLPLLARALRRHGLDVPRGIVPYVRAAALREELRGARYREIAAASLDALLRAGTTPVVVGGAALAGTVYDDWELRHCHDLDVLVRADQLPTAVDALTRTGCTALPPLRERPADGLLRHASGLHVALHTRPFTVRYYGASLERITHPRRVVTIGGVAAPTLAPEAALVHRLGHATYSASRANLHWVADAWHLVARHPTLDWEDVGRRIEEYRLALPVFVLVRWLAGFGVPVPHETQAALERGAGDADRAAEDVALGGALAGSRGRIRALWRATPSWHARLRLLRWGVMPSFDYLRSRYPDTSAANVSAGYVRRPVAFVAGAVRRRLADRQTATRQSDTPADSAPTLGA